MARIDHRFGSTPAWGFAKRREQLWGKEALDNPDLLMPPASVAASYWQLISNRAASWTFELEIRRSARSGRTIRHGRA